MCYNPHSVPVHNNRVRRAVTLFGSCQKCLFHSPLTLEKEKLKYSKKIILLTLLYGQTLLIQVSTANKKSVRLQNFSSCGAWPHTTRARPAALPSGRIAALRTVFVLCFCWLVSPLSTNFPRCRALGELPSSNDKTVDWGANF